MGDELDLVMQNRSILTSKLPSSPYWMNQVHGVQMVELLNVQDHECAPDADGSFTRFKNQVCCVMTADCLPVLICNKQGTQVASVHAGWRGLLDGILEQAIKTFSARDELLVYLGPAIGPKAFEVGVEVKDAFCERDKDASVAFSPSTEPEKWLADIYMLARQRLNKQGIFGVFGGDYCTYHDAQRFFSYRRDGQTGRMASCIWLE